MAQLITENSFKIIKKEHLSTFDEGAHPPNNWLTQLCKMLNQLSLEANYPPFGDWIFQKSSSLAIDHKLIPHLIKLYRALAQSIFPAHILDMTLSLLKDWNNECIEGLINIIESSFYFFIIKHNIFDFLQLLRIEIIELAFNQTQTDNNHTRNRMYTVASVSGYGVDAINSTDKYPGILSDEYIQKILSDAFEKNYTPLEILFKIIGKFKSDAKIKFGYQKDKILNPQHVQDFLFSIKVFFNETQNLNTYDFCICDAVSYDCLDYNWHSIHSYFFKKLIELDIIQIKVQHRQLIEKLFTEVAETPPDNLSLLFDDEVISTPIQLNHFLEIIYCKHEHFTTSIIKQYIHHLITKKHPEVLKALSIYREMDGLYDQIMENQALLIKTIFQQFKFTRPLVSKDVELFFENCPESFLRNLFLYQDEQEKNILILAATFHPNLLQLLLSQLNKLNLIEEVVIHSDKDNYNLLNATLNHHQCHAEQMLKFLKLINISPDILMQLLEAKNIFGQNSLMICINQHPSLLRYILSVVEELPIENKRKYKLFSQINKESNNSLMLALNEHVSILQAIMLTLSKLKLSALNYHQLLTQKNQLQQNVLYNAAASGEVYFLVFLKKINQLNLTISEKIALLSTVSFQSKNCFYHFGMNENQLDQKELSILSPATGKIFFNAIFTRIPYLSRELQKAFIELLIDLQLECIRMINDEQYFNPSSSKPSSPVRFHSYLAILNQSFKKSDKTDQEIYKFSKQVYDAIMDNSYFETQNSNCCFSFFHQPNDFEQVIENLKQIFELNIRLVEHQVRQNLLI